MFSEFKPYVNKLRSSGLRPTRQRLEVCKAIFNRTNTFHFTVESLKKIIEKNKKNKISTATLYNTLHAFKKKGYVKEIYLQGNKNFFDTNTKNHHHFYDEESNQIFDINNDEIKISKIPSTPIGKKIKSVEITVRIATENHNQENN